jgi:hypothetical protein
MKFKTPELELIEQIRVSAEQAAELCIGKDAYWEQSLRIRINQAVNDAIWSAMIKYVSENEYTNERDLK